MTQQVTCKMALVSGGFCFSSSMACSVGTIGQFNVETLGFDLHLLHNRQGTVAGADYQATALPRYPFLQR